MQLHQQRISRISQCDGKSAFRAPNIAEKRAKVMRRRHDRAFAAYRCDFCRLWHVGSKDSWQDSGRGGR